MQIFTRIFYERNSATLNRNDMTLYHVFAYLTFLRLEELDITDYKRLINSQEAQKMHVFLQFAFNADILREHVREDWMSVYDYQYLDEKIIGGVEKNLPAVSDIIKNVEKRATGKVTSALSVTSSQHAESITGGGLTEAALSKAGDTIQTAGSNKDELMSNDGEDEG